MEKHNEWSETKKEFRVGLIISSIIVFLILIYPGNKIDTSEKDFIFETVILDTLPVFDKEYHGKGRTNHFVKLKFKNDAKEYRIEGIDYNFLKIEEFSQINIGDTLKISRTSNSLHSIIKNEFDYLNYKKAETNRGLTIYFFGYLFIPMIPICLFVQFLKKRPHYNYKNQSKPIPLDIIVITTFVVTIIILSFTMPHFQFISNGEFYK